MREVIGELKPAQNASACGALDLFDRILDLGHARLKAYHEAAAAPGP